MATLIGQPCIHETMKHGKIVLLLGNADGEITSSMPEAILRSFLTLAFVVAMENFLAN